MITDNKPRLVVSTDSFLPRWDGIARFLINLIPDLVKEFDVTVIAPDFGPFDHPPDYRLIKIPLMRGRFGDISFSRLKYSVVRKEVKKADIVFNQTIGPVGVMSVLAAKNHHKRLVSFTHSIESELVPMALSEGIMRRFAYVLMRLLVRWIYNKPDLLINPSEWVDDQLSWQGVRTRRAVVRIGVDTKKFSPGTARTLRRKLGCSDDDIVIGHVGRLAREKDVKTILRAFIRLRKKYSNIKLLVIAKGLPSLQKTLEETEGVIYPGDQDDVVPFYRAMDVFVLASLTETTCLAALEAMSCALPIVSTPVGFVNDYLVDGVNGFFFPKKDSFKLAQKLEVLIRDPVLRKRIGLAARKTVEDNFRWSDTSNEIIRLLKEQLVNE